MKFDLASIPSGAKIKEAKLSVYVYGAYEGGANGPKSLFRVTKSWTESAVTWAAPWVAKGGDFSGTAVATNNNSTMNAWEDYAVTATIKDIVENKGVNSGFLFKFDSKTPRHGVCFRSSEYSQTEQRPKLVVTYEAGITNIVPPKFELSDMTGPFAVTITTIQGRRIASFTAQNAAQLHGKKSKLSSGTHIVDIASPGKRSVRKVWIIH